MSRLAHGGALDAAISRHGGSRESWLDLSTGINPRGWPVPQLNEEIWRALPDEGAMNTLLEAARRYYSVPSGFEIVAAPGTQALVQQLPKVIPGHRTVIVEGLAGTYGEHRYRNEFAGREVATTNNPDDVSEDCELVVIVHPNNPDGRVWESEAICLLADRIARKGGILVVDEAFCDTTPDASMVSDLHDNMVVLKSLGKFFGLAGLRLGFAVAKEPQADRLREALGPWAVSGPALAVGAAALGDEVWIAQMRKWLGAQSILQSNLLREAGLPIVGQNPLFLLVESTRAAAISETLAMHYILVRQFADRPKLLRFGLADDEGIRRLETALEAVRQNA